MPPDGARRALRLHLSVLPVPIIFIQSSVASDF